MNRDNLDRRKSCVACGAKTVGHRRRRFGFEIFRCATCGTQFALLKRDRLPTYDEHYEDESHYGGYHRLAESYIKRKPSLYWFQPKMLRIAGDGNARLHVDVGSGLGTFLCHSRERGWRVYGIDVSRSAARRAKEVFEIDTHVGSIDDVPLQPSTVHWISAFEVIEHLYDPIKYVSRFYELLAPGGLVTVSVPNGRSRQEMYSTNPIYRPPTHINYFSRVGLNRMFENAGFVRLYDYEKPISWGELRLPKALRVALLPLLVLDRVLGHGGNRLLWVGRKPAE